MRHTDIKRYSMMAVIESLRYGDNGQWDVISTD